MLILDASAKPLTRLRSLETPGWYPQDRGTGSRPYYRNVLIAAMPADELPDRWIGLEAVDVLVWDQPVPPAGHSPQVAAVMEWVRNGGQLVVGLGQAWSSVHGTELAEILPVQPRDPQPEATGPTYPPVVETQEMPDFFEYLVARGGRTDSDEAARSRTFRSPVSVATAEAKPGAVRSFRTRIPNGRVIDLVTVHTVGSGRVIAVAASLHDLLQMPVNDAFYAQLFDLNPTTKEFREAETQSFQITMGENKALYDDIVNEIGFRGRSSVLVLAAFAFVVAYVGLASLASWWWLKQHALTTISWTVFAAFAVVASTLSLGTVAVLQGVRSGVESISFVDTEAGSPQSRTHCYIGYSSPSRAPVDLSLAGEDGFLRPLTRGPHGSGTYATPRRYTAIPGRGLLEGAPRRATLKQFEGFCGVELEGSVRTQLTAARNTGEIAAGSWIANDLDREFLGGYLLYMDPRLRDSGTSVRPAGETTNWWGQTDSPPALNVLALWIPPIKPGERVSSLGREQYDNLQKELDKWRASRSTKLSEMPDLFTLWDEQRAWLGYGVREPLSGLDQPPRRTLDSAARSALLASTRTFYLHCQEDFKKVSNVPITTEGLMDCDISHWLMQGQGVLLLLSDVPGPARLQADGKPLGAGHGSSLYRVRVPIALTDSPPGRPTPPSGEIEP